MKKILGIVFFVISSCGITEEVSAINLPGGLPSINGGAVSTLPGASPSTEERSAAVAEYLNRRPPVHGAAVLPGNMGDGVSYVRDNLFPKLTNTILVTALSLSVVFLMISGVMYIISSGESDMKEKALNGIIWSVAGVVVIALSYTIVSLVIGIDFTG